MILGAAIVICFILVMVLGDYHPFLALIAMPVAAVFLICLAAFMNVYKSTDKRTKSRLAWESKNFDDVLAARKEKKIIPRFNARTKARQVVASDPRAFEDQIANMFRTHGYRVIETPYQGDHGIDLKIYRHDEYAIVQCKRYSHPVGEPIVRDFFGCMQHESVDIGYIITTSDFTKNARKWAKGKQIMLIDGETLNKLLLEADQLRSATV